MSGPPPHTPFPVPHSAVEGVAWPVLAGGIPPLLLAALQQLEQSQWLPEAELRAWVNSTSYNPIALSAPAFSGTQCTLNGGMQRVGGRGMVR